LSHSASPFLCWIILRLCGRKAGRGKRN
jgi:hypothetical protein